jgi:Fatty acid desaturase
VPFILLWLLMWWSLRIGYGIYLLLAVPAAGFLVRLFMIQHDCGHGSFFSHRLVNDCVGRVIRVFTLTPYDLWRRAHGVHHATSGNLNRRGIGDIDTLTVREYLARSRWGRLGYRLYRHPIILFGIGPAYLFLLRQRLPFGPMGDGWMPWVSTMATHGAVALVVAGMMWWIGVGPFLLVHLPIAMLGGAIGGGYSTSSSTSSSTRHGPTNELGASRRPRSTAGHIMTCRSYCAGSPPISGCTMSTTSAAESRFIDCRLCFAATPILRRSAGPL